jgi:hypothetical protein
MVSSRKARVDWKTAAAVIGALAALITAFVAVCPFVNRNRAIAQPIVAADKLFKIERALLPALEEGPARFSDLPAYFKDANKELLQHLNSIAQKYSSHENHAGATYIAGPAGVGKSYFIDQLNMLPADDTTRSIKLSQLFKSPVSAFATEAAPDLRTSDGSITFNKLMRISQPTEFDFDQFLVRAGALRNGKIMGFVLIDDLDEVHEDSARLILKELEEYLRNHKQGFVHFIVFGRPEGFSPWLKHRDRKSLLNVTNSPLVLQGPEYKTTGDLEFRCKDYYRWKYKNDAPQEVINNFRERVQKYAFLRYTIRPLSGGNFVLNESVLWYLSKSKENKTIEALRNGLFSDMMDRNKESHNRPSVNNDKYMFILERTAAFPIEEGRQIDGNGFFEAYSNDFVEFTDTEGKVHKVGIRDILNRSGIVILDPAELRRTRYRFEPFWLHAHLVEKWNQRNHPGHRYRWSGSLDKEEPSKNAEYGQN